VSVLVRITDPKEIDMPLNVRNIMGIDLEALKYVYYDGKNAGKPYVVG